MGKIKKIVQVRLYDDLLEELEDKLASVNECQIKKDLPTVNLSDLIRFSIRVGLGRLENRDPFRCRFCKAIFTSKGACPKNCQTPKKKNLN